MTSFDKLNSSVASDLQYNKHRKLKKEKNNVKILFMRRNKVNSNIKARIRLKMTINIIINSIYTQIKL